MRYGYVFSGWGSNPGFYLDVWEGGDTHKGRVTGNRDFRKKTRNIIRLLSSVPKGLFQ